LGFSDLQAECSWCKHRERSTSRVLGRHFRVLPQRLVANSLTVGSERRICGAKPPNRSGRRATPPVSERRTRGRAFRAPVTLRASPIGGRAGMLEAVVACAVPFGGRSRRSSLCAVTSDGAAREHGRNELHRDPSRSAGAVLPRHLERGRSRFLGAEATLLGPRYRSSEYPRGFLRGGMCDSTRRSGFARSSSPGGCLPPTSHRGGSRAQDTQRGSSDVSHGVRLLSAYEPRRSLCRFASPAPSALRVSHSLSGLSPPGPRGFVSRHIRP
jgi:hypothetical protein